MRPKTTSWTELSAYRQCPHKHKLQYIDGWRPPTINRPLTLGIEWHVIMDHHYSGVKMGDMVPATEAIIEHLDSLDARNEEGENHEIGATLAWMYDGYLKQWAGDRAWEILAVEGEIEFTLPSGIVLKGRYDLIVRLNKRFIWVVDHKANKTLPNQKELDLDDQTALYTVGVRKQLDLPVRGAIINSSRTERLKRPMTLEERFARYPIFRTDQEIKMIVQEADASAVKAKTGDTTRERHPDPQNCKWRCDYLEPCLAGRREIHLERQLLLAKGFHRRYDEDRRASTVVDISTRRADPAGSSGMEG